MFENMSFEYIMGKMLDRIPNTIDKREGSIIYDALAPSAFEMSEMYLALDMVVNESYADTASFTYLIKRAAERGILPYEATYAVLKGIFTPSTIEVSNGQRFSLDGMIYKVIRKIKDGEYELQCESEGSVGNKYFGSIIPIDYIRGLEKAELTELLIPGEDEEDEESLRNRYFSSFESQAFGGNVADYKEKVSAIPGVGGVKVYPVWNGGGTVKLTIIDSTYSKPSDTLIDKVQTIIDPIANQGEGVGIAPIGHAVTVAGVNETKVNIETKITYQEGWTWDDVKEYAERAVDSYLDSLSQAWAEGEDIVVRISQIETRLLNISGIIDIADTTINHETKNLILEKDNIPIRGEIIG